MGCKSKVSKEQIIEFITANPNCGSEQVHEAFPDLDRKELGARLGRMTERGEIRRVYGSHGAKHYFPLIREYTQLQTLHNPKYTREIASLFDKI